MNSIERVSLAESDGSASDSSFSRWIERPVRFVCMLTIPTSEADKWNRNFASVNPTCGYFVFLISIDSKSLFFCLTLFLLRNRSELLRPKGFAWSFGQCCSWPCDKVRHTCNRSPKRKYLLYIPVGQFLYELDVDLRIVPDHRRPTLALRYHHSTSSCATWNHCTLMGKLFGGCHCRRFNRKKRLR